MEPGDGPEVGLHRLGPGRARDTAVGVQAWAGLWERGHGAAWQADADYIEANEADWAAALLG